jgi:alkylation response protein AidB-like acyl-CoA dehydrogenase
MKVIPDSVYKQIASAYIDANGNYRDGFPDSVLRIIREQKLFKLFLPDTLGGPGMSLQETLNVIQRCAYINGTLGWLVQIGNGGNYFAAYVDEKTSHELFSPANAVLAGSGAISGTANPVDGGYNVSGKWKYASGSAYASFFTFSAKVEGGDQAISGCLMPGQVNVIDDWKSIGMRFSTTNTFTAENQFVPHKYVFGLTEQKCFRDISVFSFPFLAYAQAFFLSVQYGLLSRILHEASVAVKKNQQRWTTPYPERAKTIANSILFGMQMQLNFANELKAAIDRIESSSGEERNKHVAELDTKAKTQNAAILHQAQGIFALLGMEVLYETHPINVAYRDMMTCGQHTLLNNY